MFRKYRIQLIFLVAGIVLGYLVIHPYAMVIDALMRMHQSGSFEPHWQLLTHNAVLSFHPMMASMSLSFAFLGGIIGLLIGIIINRRKKLFLAQHESEKNRIALETIEKLMVTLSHHLLNANMIIGGKVRHCKRGVSNPDLLKSLSVIEKQGRKIDAVLRVLGRVTEIKVSDYTLDGQVTMVDIAKELEEELHKMDYVGHTIF